MPEHHGYVMAAAVLWQVRRRVPVADHSAIPLWPPALRFHARFLAPHLEPEATEPAVPSSGADQLDEPVLEGVAHELGAR